MNRILLYCSAIQVLALGVGCSSVVDKPMLEDPAFSSDEVESADRISASTRIRGSLSAPNGQARGAFGTGRSPVGYTFRGTVGKVDVSLSSGDGDAVLSVYGPLRTSWSAAGRVGYNDDAPGRGTDSFLSLNLRVAGTYLVVVREYYDSPATYAVEVATRPTSCVFEDCGPPPLLAQRVCEDGTTVSPKLTCETTPNGCGWKIEQVECPAPPSHTCRGGSCGPQPALPVERITCADGSTIVTPSITCQAQANDACGWKIEAVTCPRTCEVSECGPRPNPVLRWWSPGRFVPPTVTCGWRNGQCGWSISGGECN